jgi:hypothetical protein
MPAQRRFRLLFSILLAGQFLGAGWTRPTTARVYRYSSAEQDRIRRAAFPPLTDGKISAVYPANSMTLYILPDPAEGHYIFLPRLGFPR